MMMLASIAALVLAQVATPVPQGDAPSAAVFTGIPPTELARFEARRDSLNAGIKAESLKQWHLLLAKEPHVAGTEGGAREVERIRKGFESVGLKPEVAEFWPLLCTPVSASLEIVEPQHLALELSERPLKEDQDSAGQGFGWNAYSASGEVTAGVVYANFGTKADYQRLASMNIDTRGKIILARYGGNFRGYKAKFAEEAGAAGLIIFTDPADSGYGKGLTYPEGGYANDCCIQRGSIMTTPYSGDPLTPGTFAAEDAVRLRVEDVALPKIPVQPVSYAAAREIMSRMTGQAVPEGWQGGLPFAYRIEGGDALKVRMNVQQTREVKKAANVLARIEGREFADQFVIVGCHHDAWNCGAADPTAGTISVMECAKVFAARAAAGDRPLRTIIFATWDAEEFGIIGSSEWVEANRDALIAGGVAYINLDMAAMGLNFGASASPTLRSVIALAAGDVPQPGATGQSVLEAWRAQSPNAGAAWHGAFGDLGGGSDHVAFLCHAGMASCGLSAGGSKGNSYHSAYDTLPWYWKTVGTDYESSLMVTRITAAIVNRLAYATLLPLDATEVGADIRKHVGAMSASANGMVAASWASEMIAGLMEHATALTADADLAMRALQASLEAGSLSAEVQRQINAQLLSLDRAWMDESGLPGRPWFKNLYAAPDEDSGYASWILPGLHKAIADKDASLLAQQIVRIESAIAKTRASLRSLAAIAGMASTPASGPARGNP